MVSIATGSASINQKLDDILSRLASSREETDRSVDAKIAKVQETFSRTSAEVEKLKSEKNFVWKCEGHKIQYSFNNDATENLKQMLFALQYNKLAYIHELIGSEISRTERRNKLIKLADSTEGGWETVRQYDSNDLADDSDDDGRISRAESRALKKMEKKKSKLNRFSPYRYPRPSASVTQSNLLTFFFKPVSDPFVRSSGETRVSPVVSCHTGDVIALTSPLQSKPREIQETKQARLSHQGILESVFADGISTLPESLRHEIASLNELLNDARAPSTSKSYTYGFRRFKLWSESHGLSGLLPIPPLHCALYLLTLIQAGESISPVVTAFYSIRYVHALTGLLSPTENSLVINVLEAGKRRLSKATIKKEPVTIHVIKKTVQSLQCKTSLKDSRIVTMILIAYTGYLRSAELLLITRSDVVFSSHYMSIFIEKSKTDVYRDGAWVVIGATNTELCPVNQHKSYLKLADISDESDEYFSRSVILIKGKFRLRNRNMPMTYTRLRELFLSVISPFVSDVSKYGLHSLRSGGASAAANNGIPDRLFKRHGRWKSEKAKDGYIKDGIEARLRASLALGL